MSKLQRVDKWCPNLITNNQHYAIGEIKTWREFNTPPINEAWSIKENDFKESLKKNYHYFVVIRKDDHTNNHIFLIQTNSLGEIYEVRNLDNIPSSAAFYKKEIEPFKTIIATHVNGAMMFEFNKERKDISKEAYDVSSELFSFKEMRRGVIEHGRLCYIEGYKKHAELFYNFLIKNGYFNDFELNKIITEFDSYLNDTQAVSCNYAESLLGKIVPWLPENSYLTNYQKDVIELYKNLTNDKNILRIQKPRQGGVTTVLYLIGYMEALNQKHVLYYGYEPTPEFTSQYFTYKQLNSISELNESKLSDKRYDLIIIDEVIEFRNPIIGLGLAKKHLTENGRIIVTCTPLEKGMPEAQYNMICDFLNMTCPDIVSYKWKCTNEAWKKASKYPELINEITGTFEQ